MADWIPGIDLSNWQDLTPQKARALAVPPPEGPGVKLVIVRASHENQTLIDTTLAQMRMVVNAGLRLHAYGWMYGTESPSATATRWRALYEDLPIERFWIDCEETKYIGTPAMNVAWLQEALRITGEQWPVGIYSGAWWWRPYMADSTAFTNLPLWDASYTGVPDLEPARLYGGWTRRAIHQYDGSGSLAGISPLDLDAVDPALVGEDEDMPQVADLINQLGYLQGDVADALQEALDNLGVALASEEPPHTWTPEERGSYEALQAAINTLRRGG